MQDIMRNHYATKITVLWGIERYVDTKHDVDVFSFFNLD